MNHTQVNDDEPAFLLIECGGTKKEMVLLNETRVTPAIRQECKSEGGSNVWYMNNEASNHVTCKCSMFKELDEKISRKVRFGNGSTVKIEGKGSVAFRCKNGKERVLKESRSAFKSWKHGYS